MLSHEIAITDLLVGKAMIARPPDEGEAYRIAVIPRGINLLAYRICVFRHKPEINEEKRYMKKSEVEIIVLCT